MANDLECAALLMEVAPLVTRLIRGEMRSRRTESLSVEQFRALVFVGRREGASLSAVADHIGLTLPSVSKLIDGLVARQLVTRIDSLVDRRRISLTLTQTGKALTESAWMGTRESIAQLLNGLSSTERDIVVDALSSLRMAFSPPGDAKQIEFGAGQFGASPQ